MKNLITCIAFVGCFAFAKAQTQKTWTLQECIQYAIDNNINVKLSELQVESVAIDKRDAIGQFVPSLNGSANLSVNNGTNINPTTNAFESTTFLSITPQISSRVTLFDGLRNFKTLQRAKLNNMLTLYQLEQSENDVLLIIANNFVQILLNKENLNTIQNQHEITQLSMDNTTELVDAGAVPRGDLLEIQATYANEEQQIVAAKNAVQISKISLAQTMNLEDFTDFDVASPEFDLPENSILFNQPEDIVQKALETQPQIKVADQNIEIALKDLEIAKGARLPTLSGFFNYNTRYADNDFFNRTLNEQLYQNDGYSYGLSLNIPILNNFSVDNNISRSKLNVLRNELQKEQTVFNLKANVYQAFTDAQASISSYNAALKTVEARELAAQYAKDRYEVGLMNSFDYNQSRTQLLNAQVTVNQAKYDYIFKLKVLEIYYGLEPDQIKL